LPVYAVDAPSLAVNAAYQRSPVVALATDCHAGTVPDAVQAVAQFSVSDPVRVMNHHLVPAGADGVVIWLKGDKLLQGSPAVIRRTLLAPSTRTFVPVHLPCLPELDLIGLQPRLFTSRPASDRVGQSYRVAADPCSSSEMEDALRDLPEDWAQLYAALLASSRDPQGAASRLARAADSTSLAAPFRALAWRNLAVLLLRYADFSTAERLLAAGLGVFPDYSELLYLKGLVALRQGSIQEAWTSLGNAAESTACVSVSGGWQAFGHLQWLLASMAEQAGNLEAALPYYLRAVRLTPVHQPSLLSILKRRWPAPAVAVVQPILCGVARREPQYLEAVFYFLLLHRQTDAARRLLHQAQLAEDRHQFLQSKLHQVAVAQQPGPRPQGAKAGVCLTGPFLAHSSVARINRELAAILVQDPELDLELRPHGWVSLPGAAPTQDQVVRAGLKNLASCVDLTLRLHWPPDFSPPARGKLAVLLPWEFGGLPRRWVAEIERHVDELWVPSNFVRSVALGAGISERRIHVIPYGLDPEVFRPLGPAWRPAGCRTFIFLFVGGAIQRKGIDLLVQAYREAFAATDDVSLVVKDIGSSTFYRHASWVGRLQELARSPGYPHLVVITEEMDDQRLAALYRGCDVLVLPYRGEGFGMPLIEAMACGKPVLTTGLGPARDFCHPDHAWLVPARVVPVADEPPPFGEMAGDYTWFEPDVGELARLLRYAYAHPGEAAARGREAASRIRASHAWPVLAPLYLERVHALIA
jgi:glycosyltransferase involved in cell wall biosynthesis